MPEDRLLSLVLTLSHLTPAIPPHDLGRAAHSLFMEWLRDADPDFASHLHLGQGPKPFTISDLRGKRPRPYQPESDRVKNRYWLRFTTCQEPLSALLVERVLPNLPAQITLADMPFELLGATCDPADHSWAGSSSYQELAQGHMLAARQPGDRLELQFASPTTFHLKGKKHQPFPLPELLLGSWLKKWNAFAPIAFPLESRPFAAESLAVSRYRLRTIPARYGKATYIGFVGRCTFRILERDPYWLRLVHTLAHFAFYCGTGHKATQGLGQTRVTHT